MKSSKLNNKMIKKKIIHLDCTLRDGGYYNNWDFKEELINDYLEAISLAGIEIAEIGFRFINKIGFKGACAFSSEEFLRNINIPSNLSIGIMINSSDIVEENFLNTKALDQLVPLNKKDSVVDIIRIATNLKHLKSSLEASYIIKQKGYKVGINLTHICDVSLKDIEQISLEIKEYPLDVFYFADSMGNLKTEKISLIISALKKHWDGMIGFHAHDNMLLACANTNEAIKNGINWIDSTITGMGRGAGNLCTEQYILETNKINNNNLNILPLLKLVRKTFNPLKLNYKWGSNTFYYLAGQYNIHPTYVQEMLSDEKYDEEDIMCFIENLKNNTANTFDSEILNTAKNIFQIPPKGTWDPKNMFSNRNVLLIGVGSSLYDHKKGIENFINKFKPYVIAVNSSETINEELINLRIASNPIKIIADANSHIKFKQPLITPYSMLPKNIKDMWTRKIIYDYGIEIKEGELFLKNNYCTVPNSNVFAYALAIIFAGKATKISIAGFDGYPFDSYKNEEINEILALSKDFLIHSPLDSITPTMYQVPQKSLYAI